MKVLLMDDELMVLELLKERVVNVLPDAEIFAFSKSREALEFAKQNRIDIAFLDINMRVIDGVTVAKEIQSIYPSVNIIFCTGYKEYMQDAFEMYCSGYILKPVTEDSIRKAVEHLRYPLAEDKSKVEIRCFGNFEVFLDKKPIVFKYNRTKELLAYLVDRNGADCSTSELMSVLFEDDERRSYFNHLRTDLIDTFKKLGISDILRTNRGRLGIQRDMVKCDYFDYLDGIIKEKPNEYMAQYSFMYWL